MKPFSCLRITPKVILSICAVVFVVLAFAKNQAYAADGIFKQINFQGKLTNLNGTNVADGSYSVVFTLYDASTNGTNLWTETQSVTVADGIFRVLLGSSTSLSTVNFNKDTIYLGIKVGSDTEMTPRVRFAAVPYAFSAEKVNGLTVVNTSGNPFASTTTFRIGDGKTVSINNSLTFSGTDGTTITFPNANDTAVVLDLAQTLTNKTIGSTGLTFSAATTDLTTGTNEDFVLSPNGTGKIGFNTTSPQASFDLRYKSGTLAVASISGTTSFATLALDNYGLGDLFVASKSGFNRFVIRNDGNVGINKAQPTEALDVAGNITVSGGVYKANGSAGVSGTNSCLTTVGGIVTTIAGSCGGGGGTNYWNQFSGALSSQNDTLDFLIGGQATTSAKFAVLNMTGGTPVSTASGNFIVMPYTSGASKLGGNVGIGTTAPDQVLTVGETNNGFDQIIHVIGKKKAAIVLEADTDNVTEADTAYIKFSQDGGTSTSIWGQNANTGRDPENNVYTDAIANAFLFGSISNESVQFGTNAIVRMTLEGTSGNLGIGTITPTQKLSIVGTATDAELGLFNGSRSTSFTVNQIGNLSIVPGGGNATVSGSLQITNYATIAASLGIGNVTAPQGNGILNVSGNYQVRGVNGVSGSNSCLTTIGGIVTTIAGTCASGGSSASPLTEIASLGVSVESNATEDILFGGTATTSAKFGFLNLAGGTPTATVAGNFTIMPWTNGALQLGGNVGIGTTSPTDKLVLAGGSLVLSSGTNEGIRGGGLSDCASSGYRLTWSATSNQFGCATDKPYLTVRKSIDETVTALITPQDDNELKFTIGANETWTAQFVIQQNSGTVPDLKFAVTAPSGATCDVSINDTISNTNSVSNLGCGVSQAVTGNAADEVTLVYATIVNGSTAGTVTLQWSQNTSDASNTTVLAGSTLVATNISGANLVNMSTVPDWTVTGGTIFPRLATSMDLLVGGNSTASAKFAFMNVVSGEATASIAGSITLQNGLGQLNRLNGGSFDFRTSIGGDSGLLSRFTIVNNGNVGIGTTTPNQKFEIAGTGAGTQLRLTNGVQIADFTTNQIGNLQITPGGGSATLSGSLQVTNYATIAASLGIGNVTAPQGNGILNLSGNYQIRGIDGVSGSNSCLTTVGGIVTTIAGSCGSGGGGSATWTVANGAIFPNQASVLDLLVGGTSSTSAVFSVTHVMNGIAPIASIAGNLIIMPNWSKGDSNASGNVAIGTDSARERLTVAGNIRVESKPVNSASSTTWTRINNAPGTINSGGTSGIASISASTVYNGSLYIGTSGKSAGAGIAEVYRYNGNNSWTKLNTTAGQLSNSTGIEGITAMAVHNGQLYVGTFKPNAAEVYRYNSGTSWTQVSGAAGTIGSGQASTDAVTSLISFGGRLYAGTLELNTADILVYTGGASFNSWNRVNSAVGNICGDTSVDEITGLTVYNGSLIASYRPDFTTNVGRSRVCRITGGAVATSTLNSAVGTYNLSQGNITSIASISAMVPYNGRLMFGVRKTNQADVIGLDNQTVIAAGAGFERTNSAAGTITQGGTANIDGVTAMAVYENQLYAGTEEMGAAGAGGAEVYKYAGNDRWVKITQAAGTIAASGTTGISTIDKLLVWNNKLYAMTNRGRNGGAEIYEYSGPELEQSSYSLLFHSAVSGQSGGEMGGFENVGEIYFNATASAGLNNQGAFIFSHSIVSAGGGFDVAEDYPTHDSDLSPGDVVAMSDSEVGFVQRVRGTYNERTIGVYSEKPGFRLSQGKGGGVDGNPAIPVALVGRVPVKVSTENGSIAIGDALTSSSLPGVAMKATKAGAIIGNAMEPYDQESVGKITAYITKGTQQGTHLADLLSGLAVDSTPEHSVIGQEVFGKQLLSVLLAQKPQGLAQTSLSEVYTDRVAAGLEIVTPRITSHEIALDVIKPATASGILVSLGENGTLSISGQNGKEAIRFDSQGNAFFSGTLRADKIFANQIDLPASALAQALQAGGLEFITTGITNLSAGRQDQEVRIKELESWFASSSGRTILADRSILGASDSAVLNDAKDLLESSSTTQNESVLTLTSLQVDGLATVSGNLRTKGSGLFEGMLSVVDTLTTHNLIVSGVSTFFDEVIFKKHVTFEETPVFTPDTAGVVTIEKGNKKGDVRFSKSYGQTPIIQVSRTAIELTDDEYKEYLKDGICTDKESRDDCQEKADLSTLQNETPYIVSKKSKDGFSILLQQEAATRLQFSWTALTITKERKEVKVVNY